MKRQGKLWSVLGLFFASFSLLIGSLAHLSGVGATEVGAENTSTSTLTFTKACGGSGTADDGVAWTVASDGSESNFDNTKGIHYGTSSDQVTYITLSTSGISGTITKIIVNASTASKVSATVSTTVGGSAFGGAAKSLSASATNYTFTGSASGEIVVTVTKPSKAAKALYVKSVAVTYTAAAQSSSAESSSDTSSSASSSEPTNKAIYTVTSKNTVSASGTRPAGSDCSLAETYGTSKQMTSGNTQTYTFTGYGGTKIVGLTLSMKSNASSGAGYLSFTTGSDAIASIGASNSGIAFNNAAWHGSWSSSYVDVTVSVSETTVDTGASVVLLIGATANSFYCEGVMIEWMDAGASSATSSESSSPSATPEVTITSNVEGNAFEVGTGLTYDFVVTLTNAEPSTYKIVATGSGAVSLTSGGASVTSDTAISSGATVTATGSTKGSVTLTCTSVADSEKSVVISINVIKPFAPMGDAAGPYQLVKDPSEIAGDCYVIIVGGDLANDDAVALSTTQNTNNRGQTAVSVAEGELISFISASVQVLRLEKDESNYWTLRENKNDGGYLYAASSTENYMRTKATNDANGVWSITINSTSGVASIVAQGTNTRNVLQYNGTSNLFSCYASASQSEVYIFKAITLSPVTTLNVEDGDGNSIADGTTVNVLTNDSFKFKASVNASATLKGVRYSAKDSSDNTIELESDGDYRLLPEAKYALRGIYTITVETIGKTSGNATLSKSFSISVEDVEITTFEFRNGIGTKITTATLYLGETLDVTWAIDPDDLEHCTSYVEPASNNVSAATVTQKAGRVWTIEAVGYGEGTATISASVSSGGETLTAELVVTVIIHQVTDITVTSSNPLNLQWHSESAIATTIEPSNASIKTLSYVSSDETVCTVSSSGVVYAVEEGTATITVSATDGSDISKTITVNVNKIHVADFQLQYSSHKIYVDGTGTVKQWTIRVKEGSWVTDPSGHAAPSDTSLNFESTNTSIATVDGGGTVRAAGSSLGEVNINVTSVSDPSVSKVFVAKIVSAASYLGFSVSGFSVQKDALLNMSDPKEAPFQLYSYDGPIGDPETSSFLVEWGSYEIVSSNNAILDFDDGYLEAFTEGQVTLTATYAAGITATCQAVVTTQASAIKSIEFIGDVDSCVFGDSEYLDYIGASDNFMVYAVYEGPTDSTADDIEVDVTADSLYRWKDVSDGHLALGPHFITATYADFSVDLPMRTTNVGATQFEELTNDVDDETYSHTFTEKEIDSANTTMSYVGSLGNEVDVHYSVSPGSVSYYGYESTRGQQFGSSSSPVRTITIEIDTESDVSSVVVNASTGSGATSTINGTSLTASATNYNLGKSKTITISQPSTSRALYVKSISFTVDAHEETEVIEHFSFNEQASAFATYIGRFNTCDYASFVDRDPDTVERLALEWNALQADAKDLAREMTIKDFFYNGGEYDYDADARIDDVNVWIKVKTIVALYNIAHPDAKIYLLESGASVAKTDSTSGGTAYMTPYALRLIPTVKDDASSPLTTTLWIVLGSGLAGLAAIGGAYLFSKKKQRRDTQA